MSKNAEKILRPKKPHSIVNPQTNVRNPPSLNPAFPQPRLVLIYEKYEKILWKIVKRFWKLDIFLTLRQNFIFPTKTIQIFQKLILVDLEHSKGWIWIKCTCKIFSNNNSSFSINYSNNNFNINIQWVVLCIPACKVFFIMPPSKKWRFNFCHFLLGIYDRMYI